MKEKIIGLILSLFLLITLGAFFYYINAAKGNIPVDTIIKVDKKKDHILSWVQDHVLEWTGIDLKIYKTEEKLIEEIKEDLIKKRAEGDEFLGKKYPGKKILEFTVVEPIGYKAYHLEYIARDIGDPSVYYYGKADMYLVTGTGTNTIHEDFYSSE